MEEKSVAMTTKTQIVIPIVFIMGILLTWSGYIWAKIETNRDAIVKNQITITQTLTEMQSNRLMMQEHHRNDVVLCPADVRDAVR